MKHFGEPAENEKIIVQTQKIFDKVFDSMIEILLLKRPGKKNYLTGQDRCEQKFIIQNRLQNSTHLS